MEEQEQGSVVSLSKEEQQRDRRTKMVKRGVFERLKIKVKKASNLSITFPRSKGAFHEVCMAKSKTGNLWKGC